MSVELAPLQQAVSRASTVNVDSKLAPRIIVCRIAHFGLHLAHVQNDVLRLAERISYTVSGHTRSRPTWLYIDLTS